MFIKLYIQPVFDNVAHRERDTAKIFKYLRAVANRGLQSESPDTNFLFLFLSFIMTRGISLFYFCVLTTAATINEDCDVRLSFVSRHHVGFSYEILILLSRKDGKKNIEQHIFILLFKVITIYSNISFYVFLFIK